MDIDDKERINSILNLVSEMNHELGKIHDIVLFLFTFYIQNETNNRIVSEEKFLNTVANVMKKFKQEFYKEKNER